MNRATTLAFPALTAAVCNNSSVWNPNQSYSYSDDPVYKALSSIVCAQYNYMYKTQLIEKYGTRDVTDLYTELI